LCDDKINSKLKTLIFEILNKFALKNFPVMIMGNESLYATPDAGTREEGTVN